MQQWLQQQLSVVSTAVIVVTEETVEIAATVVSAVTAVTEAIAEIVEIVATATRRRLDSKIAILFGLGFVFSFLLPFVGGGFLRIARNVYGAAPYWGVAIVLGISLFLFDRTKALPFSLLSFTIFPFAVWIMIGAFAAFEERGRGNFWSGTVSVFLGTMVAWQGPILLIKSGLAPQEQSLEQSLKLTINDLQKNPDQKPWIEAFGFTPENIVSFVPSMIASVLLLSLVFALILDRRMATPLGLKFERIVGTPRLLDFKTPDHLIWIFILSFLLSFTKIGTGAVSIVAFNILIYLLGVYFFQGLAVLETALLIFRVGPFFKMLFYILIVGNLFFLLSLVGLVDFWMDLRRRLRQWKAKQQSNPDGT